MSGIRLVQLALICAVFMCSAFAQTTIFNVPSTDALEEKRVMVEADFLAHFDKYDNGGFQTYGYRMVYGLPKNVEIGANFFYTHNGTRRVPYELQANIKWNAYQNEKHGVAVSGGAQAFIPLNKEAGDKTYGMVYANASKTINKLNGARVTSGAYHMIGAERDFGTKKGFFFGYEQPVVKRVSFLADWYTGNNRFGYVAAGFGYAPTGNQAIYAGYNWGNEGRGNNFFSFYYAYTF